MQRAPGPRLPEIDSLKINFQLNAQEHFKTVQGSSATERGNSTLCHQSYFHSCLTQSLVLAQVFAQFSETQGT